MAIARRDESRVVSAHEARGSQENIELAGGPAEPPVVTRARNDGHEREQLRRVANELRTQAKVQRLLAAARGTTVHVRAPREDSGSSD
eukprot:8385048-Pyramimonas_sp.AAC.1